MDRLDAPCVRLGLRVRGAVQGVGFRPYVYRLAQDCGVRGFVRNDSEGVWVEVEGAAAPAFAARLRAEAPPLARIDALSVETLPLRGDVAFTVEKSQAGATLATRIPPDAGICSDCLRELFDPADRRGLYPFIACCHCGPRFSMTRALPYDRAQTAMAAFPMCAPCQAEYDDPASRRFHAEPTACADCGPRYDADSAAIWARLAGGQIVAVKGVGGFHLMCDGRNRDAVARLRARKERSGKPFAVMAANIASVRALARLSRQEEALLAGPARPIVLLDATTPDTEHLGPGLASLGVMLPATALHWLLFWEAAGRPAGDAWRTAAQQALFVCTSANPGGAPLVIDAETAAAQLAGIADAIIDHDRQIVVRVDDPAARVIAGAPIYLRRGRGVTPEPIRLPHAIAPTIAFGGHLKAAVCVTRGGEAFLAQHVGDLDDADTLRFHRETAAHLQAILAVKPERAACDLHPDFTSTHAAHETGLPVFAIQHHHAHAAACAAENGLTGAFLALTLDGYGYGEDGEAWGGECLRVDGAAAIRIGGLAPLPTPGGDRAALEPWRMAAAALHQIGLGGEIAVRFGAERNAGALAALLAAGRCGMSSSAGRLTDAAAGLLGVCVRQGYEAEAAMRLEALCDRLAPPRGLWLLADGVLDFTPLLAALAHAPPRAGARLLHSEMVGGFAALAKAAAQAHGLTRVALTGGCFANRHLSEGLSAALRAAGLSPFSHHDAPPGDGGLALGQAWAAGLCAGG
jgi:hydrogenase maturation protein HypF